MSDYAWKKKNTRNVVIGLNKNTCGDVIEMLDKQPSKQAYIVNLIREDIKRQNGEKK